MSAVNYDVLIIGGGMVGLAMACALGQQGMRVAVFDRHQAVPFDPDKKPELRVSALSYASENLLRHVGAWPYMEAMRMCPYRKMAVWEKLHTRSGREIHQRPNQTIFDAKTIGQPQLGFIVENQVTQQGLLSALKTLETVDYFYPAAVASMAFSSESSSIKLESGERFTGQLIIGADGAQSEVRQRAGIGLSIHEYEQQCLVATVELGTGGHDITWQAFTETGPEAFLPLPDIQGRYYASIVWYHLPESVQRLMNSDDKDFLETLTGTFSHELPPVLSVKERGFFPLAKRHAHTYCKPGVVLVGDAAHTINPLAGQGVNLGFQDVACLTEKLTRAFHSNQPIGSPDILSGYEKSRRHQNQLMMSTMDLFYYMFGNNRRPLKLFRNVALGVAGQSGPLVKKVMKYAMGLSGKQSAIEGCPRIAPVARTAENGG